MNVAACGIDFSRVLSEVCEWTQAGKNPVIMASTTGQSALKVYRYLRHSEILQRLTVIHHPDFRVPKKLRFDPGIKRQLINAGVRVEADVWNVLPPLGLLRWFGKMAAPFFLCSAEKKIQKQWGVEGRVAYKLAQIATRLGLADEGECLIALAGVRRGIAAAAQLWILLRDPLEVEFLKMIKVDRCEC